MNSDERQLLSTLFERVRSAATQPRDPEAESLVNDAVRAMPFAPYVLAQAALVLEQNLKAAQGHIQQLEAELQRQQGAPAPQATSFLGGLFGGPAQPAAPARPVSPPPQAAYQQPAYAPPPSPGPWGAAQQQAGSSFLGSAMRTATGVAGGMLLADGLSSLFGGHHGGGLFGGMNAGYDGSQPVQNETIVNNYYGDDPGGQGQDDTSYAGDSSDGGGFDGSGFDSGSSDA